MTALNEIQKKLFEDEKLSVSISKSRLVEVCSGDADFVSLDSNEQLDVLKLTNAFYRSGQQIIDDLTYDAFLNEFKAHHPHHEYVTKVEPEVVTEGKTVTLPVKMLSTDKAYTVKEIRQWLNRIIKAANSIDLPESEIELRVTPKLDGYAAYDDGKALYTRGDGIRGRDISFVFDRGLQVGGINQRGLGQGEIVISKSYFNENLSEYFENSRNMQASIIAEKNMDKRVQKAINNGAAVFYPFSQLKSWEGSISELLSDFDDITKSILKISEYDVDGVIIEAKNLEIKDVMGATRHHHRWQIALKSNDEKAEVAVTSVIPQTSRNGKVTPVAQLEPTRLSGAEISKATAHHYGMVRDKGIGEGAVIELVRSGLVIPKIVRVIIPATPEIPEKCPCCGSTLVWVEDNLFCMNSSECKDQIEKSIIHFFDTLGNNDGFGAATVSILNDNGISSVYDIYQLVNNPDKLAEIGYKERTVGNLIDALNKSRTVQIEDWRFLAAFGVNRLGLGVAEKLLQHHSIESIFDLLVEDLVKIDGFAKKSAKQIVDGLSSIKEPFSKIFSLGFNLEITPNISEAKDLGSPITDKTLVFTGSMQSGSRSDMEKNAKLLGAKVAKSVSGKTDYLVTGDKVGAKKITDAQNKGVTVISEGEYINLIKD